MAYLGNAPAENYISFERQVFTIVNSQTAYTLDHSVTNENDIRLVINNVVQEPGSGKAYTASGTVLTLSAALVNGTDEMYCVFLGRAVGTVNPPAGSVSTSQLASDAVTEAKIADNAVESEHLNDNVISGQTELAVAPASTDELLISDGGVLKRIDFSLIGGVNTPAFMVKQTGTQNITTGTWTKIQFNSEVYDTDGTFDSSSNYRFTPAVAGKYNFYLGITLDDLDDDKLLQAQIYKNGSGEGTSLVQTVGNNGNKHSLNVSWSDTSDSDDYYEGYVYHNIGSSEELRTDYQTIFMGYKIIE
tara:strand:+ start:818 stop:1726 length:909 start_codon:yes stop_codon:yes gene_type:complete